MPELPADFDLKIMPDWLKEPPTKNPYADYEGRDEDPRRRGRDDWGGGGGGRGRGDDRRGRPAGQRPGGPPRDGARRDDRPRKDGPAARKPDGQRPARTDDRRGRPGEQRRTDDRDRPAQQPQAAPANVAIEFFPDESCALSIAKQVKSTHRAYSLFDLARMFLARPERHRLKITTKTVAEALFQVGDNGPVWTDRAAAERSAFPIAREKYYVEITEQREAPKGNFSNVARCRANGVLLGPTSYHGYQPALRRLFDERFSRRMSYQDFLREIEVVNDPALVEQWKQQASSVTIYRLAPPAPVEKPKAPEAKIEIPAVEAAPVPEAPSAESPEPAAPEAAEGADTEAPIEAAAETTEPTPEAEAPAPAYDGPTFNSLSEVEAHFKEHYLPKLIRTGSSFHLSGEASRTLSDRGIATAVRMAWEQERGFPGQMMHQLRQQFSRSGLQVFKHRKRMQFVSLIRPSPMENGSLSASVAEILQAIQASSNCNRASLATTILGADESAVDQARKSTLATDLRWLIETGRVIEFSDGRLELPLAPAKPEPGKPGAKATEAAAESATTSDPAAESPAPVAAEEAPAASTPEPAHAEAVPSSESMPPEPPASAAEPAAEAPVTEAEPRITGEPVAIEEPAVAEEPIAAEEPVATEAPVATDEPVPAAKPD
jgi:hypothetical protein